MGPDRIGLFSVEIMVLKKTQTVLFFVDIRSRTQNWIGVRFEKLIWRSKMFRISFWKWKWCVVGSMLHVILKNVAYLSTHMDTRDMIETYSDTTRMYLSVWHAVFPSSHPRLIMNWEKKRKRKKLALEIEWIGFHWWLCSFPNRPLS